MVYTVRTQWCVDTERNKHLLCADRGLSMSADDVGAPPGLSPAPFGLSSDEPMKSWLHS